jgi:imidazolonepropionase-like amidohydrolase
VDEEQRILFVGWYTFENLLPGGPAATAQRWLTIQGEYRDYPAPMPVYRTEGGVFDDPAPTETVSVGTATLGFTGCNEGWLQYSLDDGANGEIPLVRLLPVDESTCFGLQAPEDAALEVSGGNAVAFVDVTVLPMDRGDRMLPHQVVLVENGLIAEVGPVGSVPLPEDAVTIDGRQRYLMPGLVDTHTHLATNVREYLGLNAPSATVEQVATNQLILYLANGVTTIFNLGDFGELLPFWAREVRDGVRIGPTIYSAMYARGGGNSCDGGPSNRTVAPNGGRQYVRSAHNAGYDMMKIYNCTPQAAVFDIIDEARQLGMPVTGHIPTTVDAASVLTGGLDLLAHAEAYSWAMFSFQTNPALIPGAVSLTKTGAVFVSGTAGIWERIDRVWCNDPAGVAAFFSHPDAQYMHATEIDLHRRGITSSRWNPAGCAISGIADYFEFQRRVLRALRDGGVPLLMGTDSPTVLGAAGFSAHDELLAMERAGLSPPEVLEISTRNGGIFIEERLDATDRFGQITPGYRADLLLLSRNPLQDLNHVETHRVGVMARGHWRSTEFFGPLLEDIRQQYRAAN